MGWVHRLSEIDTEARTAICDNCGPVSVVRSKTYWRCQVANAGFTVRRRARLREIIQEIRQSGCSRCSERDPVCIDFHHRDPSQKSFLISNAPSLQVTDKSLLDEIAKCDLLCANCHRKAERGREYTSPQVTKDDQGRWVNGGLPQGI